MIDFTQLGLNTFQKQINPRDIFMRLTNKTENISIQEMCKAKFGSNGLSREIIEIQL